MRYEVEQRVIDFDGAKGVVKEVDSEAHMPYFVQCDNGNSFWYFEKDLSPDYELLQAENERLKAIAAQVQTWVDEMEDYDANDYGLTPEEKSVMRAYQRVLALFSEVETK